MATLNSVKFKCRSWHSDYDKDEYDFFEWKYQTTADSFSLLKTNVKQRCAYGHNEYPEEKIVQHYGHDEAQALYQCLRNWVRRYCGDTVLKRLDEEELEKE